MAKEWQEWTYKELSDEAQTGQRGQGAVVEAMRRLKEAIVNQQRSTNRLTIVLVILTIVLVALATIQLIIFLP